MHYSKVLPYSLKTNVIHQELWKMDVIGGERLKNYPKRNISEAFQFVTNTYIFCCMNHFTIRSSTCIKKVNWSVFWFQNWFLWSRILYQKDWLEFPSSTCLSSWSKSLLELDSVLHCALLWHSVTLLWWTIQPSATSWDVVVVVKRVNIYIFYGWDAQMTYLDLFLCIKRPSHLLLQEGVSALKSLILHRQLTESQLRLLLQHSLSTGRWQVYGYSLETRKNTEHTRTSSRSSSGVQGVRSVW